MASLQVMKRYATHYFEDWGGCTSVDYKTFERKYINFIKSLMKKNGGELISANKNHYCFSAVVKRSDGQLVYISISDVRYFKNEWLRNILVRTMAHEEDWTGGSNHHTNIDNLEKAIHSVR